MNLRLVIVLLFLWQNNNLSTFGGESADKENGKDSEQESVFHFGWCLYCWLSTKTSCAELGWLILLLEKLMSFKRQRLLFI